MMPLENRPLTSRICHPIWLSMFSWRNRNSFNPVMLFLFSCSSSKTLTVAFHFDQRETDLFSLGSTPVPLGFQSEYLHLYLKQWPIFALLTNPQSLHRNLVWWCGLSRTDILISVGDSTAPFNAKDCILSSHACVRRIYKLSGLPCKLFIDST